jgi:hypothetical protein
VLAAGETERKVEVDRALERGRTLVGVNGLKEKERRRLGSG